MQYSMWFIALEQLLNSFFKLSYRTTPGEKKINLSRHMHPDTYTYACIYINLFVYVVRTTSGNRISKKKKTRGDKDDVVCFFLKKKVYRGKMKGFSASARAKYYPTQSSRKMQYSMWFIALAQAENPFFNCLTVPPLRFLYPTVLLDFTILSQI